MLWPPVWYAHLLINVFKFGHVKSFFLAFGFFFFLAYFVKLSKTKRCMYLNLKLGSCAKCPKWYEKSIGLAESMPAMFALDKA